MTDLDCYYCQNGSWSKKEQLYFCSYHKEYMTKEAMQKYENEWGQCSDFRPDSLLDEEDNGYYDY